MEDDTPSGRDISEIGTIDAVDEVTIVFDCLAIVSDEATNMKCKDNLLFISIVNGIPKYHGINLMKYTSN